MSRDSCTLHRLTHITSHEVGQLAELLIDVVDSGASVGFMHPLAREHAEAFWTAIAHEVALGRRALIAATDHRGICGTVHLVLAQPDNQPHRADLVKMLVHRRARRQGVGAALLLAAENLARSCGRSLLVLDAVTGGDAARLYEKHGWLKVGDIPGYARYPDGRPCGTTYYYRILA
ncbi:MAG: GNAT family N-acetyltransferase [Phycisphaeraceae bacterium]|nr:GNAT family N-acetyltransferase [Phycisphaeraceae bacterium]MCW5755283.1 GNAT family N-acetyltransferase [Phycisphaeraceae bacterium]